MAFIPSNNILDKDTHNMLVKSFVNGGIGYTEDDGTVHKISGDYVESGSSLPEVSADDNGDVLTVVEGEWAKATPSGGGGSFVITVSNAGVMDKTFQEIFTAMRSSLPVVVFSASDNSIELGVVATATTNWTSEFSITVSLFADTLESEYFTATSADGYPSM